MSPGISWLEVGCCCSKILPNPRQRNVRMVRFRIVPTRARPHFFKHKSRMLHGTRRSSLLGDRHVNGDTEDTTASAQGTYSDLFHDTNFKGRMAKCWWRWGNAESQFEVWWSSESWSNWPANHDFNMLHNKNIQWYTWNPAMCLVLWKFLTLESLWVLCSILAPLIWTPYSPHNAGKCSSSSNNMHTTSKFQKTNGAFRMFQGKFLWRHQTAGDPRITKKGWSYAATLVASHQESILSKVWHPNFYSKFYKFYPHFVWKPWVWGDFNTP